VTIFEKIVAGEIPCYKIAETEEFLAFLDVFPLQEGHTLVIPKKAVDYIFDLEDQLYSDLHIFAKKVAKAVDHVMPCNRVAVTVIGLEVPHAHIHLIPINHVGDVSFEQPKLKLSNQQMTEIATKIADAYKSL
jgi:histidine triad (HIT) family protein